MKKFIALSTCVMLLVGIFAVTSFAAYYDDNSGDSWENAYIIASSEDLMTMRDRVNARTETGKYYKLTTDLDLTSQTTWIPIGKRTGGYSSSSTYFDGHFDGQQHTIKMDVNRPSAYDVGLFGILKGTTNPIIRNLNVEGKFRGLWVGAMTWGMWAGTIENCTVSADVVATVWAGGYVDLMYGGTITNCSFRGISDSPSHSGGGVISEFYGGNLTLIKVTNNTQVTGKDYSGGIVGLMHGGHVSSCNTSVALEKATWKGGIIGYTTSKLMGELSNNKWPSEYRQVGNVADSEAAPDTKYDTLAMITWNDHTYTLYKDNLTWDQAQAECVKKGGHLVTITSEQEQNAINGLLASADVKTYWIGGSNSGDLGYQWVTGEIFKYKNSYSNFATAEPIDGGKYLYMYAEQILSDGGTPSDAETIKVGQWGAVETSTKDGCGYICEIDGNPSFQKATLSDNFTDWQNDPKSWYATLEKDSNGALLFTGTIPEPEDFTHLKGKLKASTVTGSILPSAVPTKYDARTDKGLPAVRNQFAYTTDWAHAVFGAMEANYMAQSLGTNPDLSELHMAWFVYKDPAAGKSFIYDTNTPILNNGGNTQKALAFLTRMAGPVDETSMPYSQAGDDSVVQSFVGDKGPEDYKRTMTLKEAWELGPIGRDDIAAVKEIIMENGAIFATYSHNSDAFQGGTYYSEDKAAQKAHSVVIVGWDDDFDASKFAHKPSANGAWLVRDSKGSTYGTDGYFWLSYDQDILNAVVFIVGNPETLFDVAYEADELGKTGNINAIWAANIYQVKDDETVKRVSLYATHPGTKYEVYVNNLGKNKPSNPGIPDKVAATITSKYAGYFTVDLTDSLPCEKGEYFSVIVKAIPSSEYAYVTATSGPLENYSSPITEKGVSFFAYGDEIPSVWQDGHEKGLGYACIKAFTNNGLEKSEVEEEKKEEEEKEEEKNETEDEKSKTTTSGDKKPGESSSSCNAGCSMLAFAVLGLSFMKRRNSL